MSNTLTAKPGDVVVCCGIRATIKEIYYQDYYDGPEWGPHQGWMIEFRDTEGNYRYWKQQYDGGHIEMK